MPPRPLFEVSVDSQCESLCKWGQLGACCFVRDGPGLACQLLTYRVLMSNSHDFLSDHLGRKNKIDESAVYCTFRHIRLRRRIGFLGNRNPAGFFYCAKSRCTITIVTGNNNSDEFSTPVFRH